MDTSGPGSASTDEQKVRIQPGILSSGAEMAAQRQNPSHAPAYSDEKQVGASTTSSYYSSAPQSVNNGLGYSDLEAVEPAGLEVAGGDGPQISYVPAPKFDEHQGQFSPSTHATQDPFNPQAPPGRRRIWGMRRRMFWIVLGVVLFGVLLALGVGIGVGVGLDSGGDAGSARYVAYRFFLCLLAHSHLLLPRRRIPVLGDRPCILSQPPFPGPMGPGITTGGCGLAERIGSFGGARRTPFSFASQTAGTGGI